MIFLSIGHERRKKYARRFPHTDVDTISTKELWEQLEITFIRTRSITYDRFFLLTIKQRKQRTVEQFHLALRELAEHCNLGGIEDELIRDLFLTNMYDQESQKELLKETLDPEKASEKAMAIEMGNFRQTAIRAEGESMISIVGRSELICNNNSRGRGNKRRNYRYARQGNKCRNLGWTWNPEHRNNCPAKRLIQTIK